jgi:hypothetical protein
MPIRERPQRDLSNWFSTEKDPSYEMEQRIPAGRMDYRASIDNFPQDFSLVKLLRRVSSQQKQK